MIRTSRIIATLAIATAATLLTAGPALAKTTPPPAPTALFCPSDLQNGHQINQPDGSVLFCVEALGAGAVVVQTGSSVNQVIVAPGWTAAISGSGGNRGQATASGKADIRFASTAAGKVEVRIEAGKIEVKGD